MDIAGIILAGGLGSRMGHTVKAHMQVGGRRILDRLLDVYHPLFREVIVAARHADEFPDCGALVAADLYVARSSLTGIHAGLDAMRASHGFFAACDAPFLQPGLVTLLLDQVTPDCDVVIPLKEDGYREPLCAVYSKRCLPFIQAQLENEDFKIIRFFEHVRVKEVPVAALVPGDPSMLSFFNVNTPEDLARAERLAEE